MRNYILVDRRPVPIHDIQAWAEWFETADRVVAQTPLPDGGMVSTVFLGLDHNYGDLGPPILFESMVFGPEHETTLFGKPFTTRDSSRQERYRTWDEAEAGHRAILAELGVADHPKRRITVDE